ncbi:MAG TPA: ankyrin repeat domain-containing protein [Nitrososphaerales archaeon]|nr:ankyrin repeat domain-containing protein [Nitrososphaerales archaeon]
MESRATPDELFAAIKKGDDARIGELLERDRDLANARDREGMSPVTIATYYGRTGIADRLISSGANLDLHEASMTGRMDVVKNLLSNDRSRAGSLSKDGFTALHLAAFFCHKEVAEYLVKHGADVNALANNATKVRPLHSAVAHRHLEISKLLVDHGADVNARQQGGFTPLHEAAFGGSLELAQMLLKHGADMTAKTDKGLTALALTSEESPEAGPKLAREKVAHFLKEKGAH